VVGVVFVVVGGVAAGVESPPATRRGCFRAIFAFAPLVE